MRIIVDMQPAARAHHSGVGVYTAYLVDRLAKNNPDKLEIVGHYYNFLGRQYISPLPQAGNIRYKVSRLFPEKGMNLIHRFKLNIPFEFLAKSRGDLYLFPNFVAPPSILRTPAVNVIHDLSFVHYGQFTQHRNLPYMLRYVPKSIKRAKHVIAVSESTKRQIVDHYKTNPDKISVVSPAIDHRLFYPRSDNKVAQVRRKYKLPPKYILYTGTLEPRKNVEGILRSYAALDTDLKKKYGLVLAGGKGWNDQTILEIISQLRKAGENIVTTGYVPDENLPAIYSGADLFVYPSLYEGFGIPLLEAMACGVPVISADNTSLPEVVGNAGLYVKAEDANGLTVLMKRVLTNSKLADELRRKGLAQAKKFSWEKSAEELKAVLEKL